MRGKGWRGWLGELIHFVGDFCLWAADRLDDFGEWLKRQANKLWGKA